MENKEWKPEVGKTAWVHYLGAIYEVELAEEVKLNGAVTSFNFTLLDEECSQWKELIYETAEKALWASIKVYGLDGNEVDVPRASEIPVHFTGVCGECHNKIELSEEEDAAFQRVVRIAYSLPATPNPEGEARLKKAQERFMNLEERGGDGK